jgi:hypothetical protein
MIAEVAVITRFACDAAGDGGGPDPCARLCMIGKPPTRSATQVYRWLDLNAYRKSTGSGLLIR